MPVPPVLHAWITWQMLSKERSESGKQNEEQEKSLRELRSAVESLTSDLKCEWPDCFDDFIVRILGWFNWFWSEYNMLWFASSRTSIVLFYYCPSKKFPGFTWVEELDKRQREENKGLERWSLSPVPTAHESVTLTTGLLRLTVATLEWKRNKATQLEHGKLEGPVEVVLA